MQIITLFDSTQDQFKLDIYTKKGYEFKIKFAKSQQSLHLVNFMFQK